MSIGSRRAAAPKAAVAVLLAGVAGYVDALGYLTLGGVLVAHMSGNTAVVAVHGVQHAWSSALLRLWPIPAFVAGAMLGAAVAEVVRRRNVRRRYAVVLAIELALLASFIALRASASLATVPAVVTLAAAMGVQNAVVHHVGGHDVRTTFVTGMLVSFADELVAALFRLVDGDRRRVRGAFLHAGVWLAFAAGATLGAVAAPLFGTAAALAPLFTLAALAAVDVAAPLGDPRSTATR